MNKKFTYLSSFLIGLVVMLLSPLVVHAQEGEPIISFHTNVYAKAKSAGTTPMVYLSLGATEKTTLSVDGGNGEEEAEVGIASLTTTEQGEVAVKGSPVSLQVDDKGWVKIYGDASKIDYFNASGQEIDQIKFSDQLGLKILNLEHNSLQALNIDKLQKLQVIYLEDNPFTAATPLMIGRLPNLQVLEVTQIGHISPSFTLKNFPKLVSFDAYHTLSLTSCDPTGCENLRRLSLDMTSVSSVDLSKNPLLEVLNVSDSRIKNLDLSRSGKIKQLYASHSSGSVNTDIKFDNIDVTRCPLLTIFYCDGNNLTNLNLTRNPELFTFSCARNKLRSLDLTKNTKLYSVNVRYNYLDFVTLPQPKNWFEYYHEQNDLEVNPTYSVGSVVDLSSRVNRPNSTTNGVLYRVPKDDPTKPEKLSDEYYDYNNGKLTLKRAVEGEVFIQYENSVLKDYSLRTANFRVKTTAEFGQDDKAFSFVTGNAQGSAIKMAIGVKDATAAAPVKVKIDFGDGTKVERTIVDELPTAVNVTGTLTGSNVVTVYVPQDKQITALGTDGVKMSKIDLDNLPQLRHLALIHADLDSVGLGYNNKLETLDLSYNNMRKVSLKGPSTYFDKSILTDINLSHNKLETIEYNNITVVRHLDVSYNNLVKLGVNNADNLRSFDASHNQFNTMLLNHSELLESLNISYNQLSKFYVPANAPLKTLDIRGNFFTLATMPDYLGLGQGKFLYAPQNPLEISTASPGIDLSEQYVTKNGKVTQFVWKKLNNQALIEGTDYTINKEKQKEAKYLNSPESDIYHKSNILYGIFQAKPFIAKEDNCYLVEGYTDVIQLYQRGIKNVVASSGTALTQEQIRLMRRLTPNVTILYDGDAAGLRAAIRGVDLILAEGMNVRICTFPEGEDPDSFAKSNSLEEIQAYFSEHTQDFIRFKASLLIEEAQDDPMKRADTIRSMIESISKIADPIKREIYVRECAKIMEISEEVLFASLAQMNQQQLLKAQQELKKVQKETPMAAVKTPERLPPIAYLEKDLIKYLLLYGPKECVFEDKFIYYDPETGEEKVQEISQKAKVYEKLFLELQADEIELSTAEFKEIYTFFIDKYQHGLEDISTIINELPVSMASIIATFQAQEEEIRLHNWREKGVEVKPKEADLSYAINGIVLNLRKILIDKKIEELRAEIIQLEAEKGDPTWAIQEIMEYNVLKNTISRRLGSN